MATYYWVGGTGSWSNSNPYNWASTSGGVGGIGVPTSTDDVVFDANSDTGGPFTVTIGGTGGSNYNFCKTFSTGGSGGALDQIMTLAGVGRLVAAGNVTFPAVNFASTYTGALTMIDTATVTTNGIAITQFSIGAIGTATNPLPEPNFSLVVTLGSAFTGNSISANFGTFDTNNFNVTLVAFGSTLPYTRVMNFGSSVVSISGTTPLNITTTSGLTFNAGTSTINCSATSILFNGAGLTYYDVAFTSTAKITVNVTGSNTFRNWTYAANATLSTPVFNLTAGTTQTVTGTLTLPAPNSANIRTVVKSFTFRVQATINAAAVNAFTDCDFRDVVITGAAAPMAGTRVGDAQNNSGITFTAGVNKYFSFPTSANWFGTVWALTSGGAPALNNIPLVQDTIIIDDAGPSSGSTISFNLSAFVGEFTTASRTIPIIIAFGNTNPGFYKSVTLSSAVTITTTGSALLGIGSGYGVTQTLTSAGVAWPRGFSISPVSGTFTFADAVTVTGSIVCQLATAGQNWTGTVKFKNGVTHTATSFGFQSANTNMLSISSTTPGSQYTLSAPTLIGSASFNTITDSIATGGAAWLAPLNLGNINGGNNTGWQFSSAPSIAGKITGFSFGFKL